MSRPSSPACQGLPTSHGFTCLERPNTYLLPVEWDRLVDHTEGFRGSPHYQEWRRLVHSIYEPFPEVEHYEHVHYA